MVSLQSSTLLKRVGRCILTKRVERHIGRAALARADVSFSPISPRFKKTLAVKWCLTHEESGCRWEGCLVFAVDTDFSGVET